MSKMYQYTGTPYTNFEGSPEGVWEGHYSSANHMTVTIKTLTVIAAGLSISDALPEGTLVSISDGSLNYSDLSPGENPPPPGLDGGISLEVQLSTDSTGRIVAWSISLDDNSYLDGMPITVSYGISTSNVAPKTPLDQSWTSVDPTGVEYSGFTNVPGTWVTN